MSKTSASGALILALALALALAPAAYAMSSNPDVSRTEWRLLPRECLYVEFGPEFRSQTAKKMREADPTWIYMHHYCWAIVQEFRTFRHGTDKQLARAYYDAAVHNLDFVIDRSRPGFVFRVDMFVRKARLLARLGKFMQAADTASQLISESPELPEGYIALADVQIKAGQSAQARDTLQRGEAAVTDKERFERLKAQLVLK